MSSLFVGLFIGFVLLLLFLTGMPIAFALGLTAILTILLFLEVTQFLLFGQLLFGELNNFALLAIPLFVLMGNLFGGSRASTDLFTAGEAWLGNIRGGLGMSTIMASTTFSAMTGSSPAVAAAVGRVAVPEMRERGYSNRIATGAVAAGGTLGILVPPSITLILYGIASGESIGRLFAAGLIPTVLIVALFCVWLSIAVTIERRREARTADRTPLAKAAAEAEAAPTAVAEHPAPSDQTPAGSEAPAEPAGPDREGSAPRPDHHDPEISPWRWRMQTLVRVLPFLVLIGLVMAVLYTGVATPSETAAVGTVLVFLFLYVVYRGIGRAEMRRVVHDTTNQSTMILMIVAFSALIAVVMSFMSIPQDLAAWVAGLDVNRWVLMLLINLALLALGLFLPPVSVVVMVTPILFPIIIGLGFDPIWFGVIMTVNMEIGLITPPVGLNLYVLKGVAPDVPTRDILLGSLPYVGVLALAIFIMSLFPDMVTWLPNLLFE